ncbi:hypothetical protein Tco_0888466 [Tanacetum coccineum]|uniref:Uncharacterized protein n=1 Tax=Tanacetum coccineum TaxID=301880 RepID=A0ABQ5AFN4_9ASTR
MRGVAADLQRSQTAMSTQEWGSHDQQQVQQQSSDKTVLLPHPPQLIPSKILLLLHRHHQRGKSVDGECRRGQREGESREE